MRSNNVHRSLRSSLISSINDISPSTAITTPILCSIFRHLDGISLSFTASMLEELSFLVNTGMGPVLLKLLPSPKRSAHQQEFVLHMGTCNAGIANTNNNASRKCSVHRLLLFQCLLVQKTTGRQKVPVLRGNP